MFINCSRVRPGAAAAKAEIAKAARTLKTPKAKSRSEVPGESGSKKSVAFRRQARLSFSGATDGEGAPEDGKPSKGKSTAVKAKAKRKSSTEMPLDGDASGKVGAVTPPESTGTGVDAKKPQVPPESVGKTPEVPPETPEVPPETPEVPPESVGKTPEVPPESVGKTPEVSPADAGTGRCTKTEPARAQMKLENQRPTTFEAIQQALSRQHSFQGQERKSQDRNGAGGSSEKDAGDEQEADVSSEEPTREQVITVEQKKAAHARYMRFSRSLKSHSHASAVWCMERSKIARL